MMTPSCPRAASNATFVPVVFARFADGSSTPPSSSSSSAAGRAGSTTATTRATPNHALSPPPRTRRETREGRAPPPPRRPLRSENARDGVERVVHVCVLGADRKVADDGVERALRGVVGEERVERDARPRAEYATGDRPGDARDSRGSTRGGQRAPSFLVEIDREEIARRARRLLVRLHRVHRHSRDFRAQKRSRRAAPEPRRQRAGLESAPGAS